MQALHQLRFMHLNGALARCQGMRKRQNEKPAALEGGWRASAQPYRRISELARCKGI